jgi:DNA repair protein RecN (Recombination protein N)
MRAPTRACVAALPTRDGAPPRTRLADWRARRSTRQTRDREWLEHCVAELRALGPRPGEDAELAEARAAMQKGREDRR